MFLTPENVGAVELLCRRCGPDAAPSSPGTTCQRAAMVSRVQASSARTPAMFGAVCVFPLICVPQSQAFLIIK